METTDGDAGPASSDLGRSVLDVAGTLMIVLDATGRVTVFNRRCEQFSGYPAAAAVGRPFWEIGLRPERVAAARAQFATVAGRDFPLSVEEDWIVRDGTVRRVRWTVTALTSAEGRLQHLVVTGADVTDHRYTERLLSNVLAAATEQAIFAVDTDGVFVLFNAGAERLLGYRAAELVGQVGAWILHLPDEIAARAAVLGVEPGAEVFTTAARAGRADTRDWTLVRKDGSHVAVSLSISRMSDEIGRTVGYVGVARDVTAERQAAAAMDQALERERAAAAYLHDLNEIRTQFVANVSHELRTPLASIIGATEILLDGPAAGPHPATDRMLGIVDRNARRLQALVHDLLAISNIETGAIKMNVWPVAAATIIGDALDAVSDSRAGRHLDLSVELPDAHPDRPAESPHIDGDARHLTRALANVIGNAVKFTPDGGRVQVTAVVLPTQVEIRVADSGVGIPADEIPHVFERFYRSTRSRHDEIAGTGLGLSIARSIVEHHGGSITVASRTGRGTDVTIRLPRSMPTELPQRTMIDR